MDRNQIIGIILISLLILMYQRNFGTQQAQQAQEVIPTQEVIPSESKCITKSETVSPKLPYNLESRKQGTPNTFILENNDIKATFSTHGGGPKQIVLKGYKTGVPDSVKTEDRDINNPTEQSLVILMNEEHSPMGLIWKHNSQIPISTADLHFSLEYADSKQVVFVLPIDHDKYLRNTFTLADTGYEIIYQWEIKGLNNDASELGFTWAQNLYNTEFDLIRNRKETTINAYDTSAKLHYLESNTNDTNQQTVSVPITWIGIKQRFFTAGVTSYIPFIEGTIATREEPDKSFIVKNAIIQLKISQIATQDLTGSWKFYFGPNDPKHLKSFTEGFGKNLSMGWPVVREVNTLLIMPVFSLFETWTSNYGLIILLLVIFIKLLTFIFSYRSHINTAKMRLLKPALDKLKTQYGDSKQKLQVAQMNLYREVGINPLMGFVPILLQMPILIAMFNFLPNSISLRQKSFLWAHDLSTYDSIAQLPFNIPLYGDHISLLTILMTISTIFYSHMHKQNTSEQTGSMKIITYMMPLMFLGILNNFPSSLSLYYLISNTLSIGEQVLMKKFINENRLRAELMEYHKKSKHNSNKPRRQQRLERKLKN